MKRNRSRYLLLSVLLAFAGQALALPFLDCCNGMSSESSDTDVMSSAHHGMPMTSDAPVHDHATMIIEEEAQSADSAQHNCNHDCAFCIISTVTVLADPGYQQVFALSVNNTGNNSLFTPSARPDHPFRPPIFA